MHSEQIEEWAKTEFGGNVSFFSLLGRVWGVEFSIFPAQHDRWGTSPAIRFRVPWRDLHYHYCNAHFSVGSVNIGLLKLTTHFAHFIKLQWFTLNYGILEFNRVSKKWCQYSSGSKVFRKRATCHYYDCNRVEIHAARFKSRVWPLAVITCPRRFGAEYVSVSYEEDEEPQEPIPLTYRAYDSKLETEPEISKIDFQGRSTSSPFV